MAAPPPIPPILTKANWDKNKGVFAKIAGKTGIGEAMTAVDTAYKNVDWSKFNAKAQLSRVMRESEINNAVKVATKENSTTVEALRQKVTALKDLANTTKAAFEKKKTIPASSTKHVASVAAAAQDFLMALKSNSSYFDAFMKTFEDEREELHKKQKVAATAMKNYIKSLTNFGQKVLENPTVDEYIGEATSGFHQNVRGLGAALALQADPPLEKFRDDWVAFTVAGFLPKEDKDVVPKVTQVLKKLQQLPALLPK